MAAPTSGKASPSWAAGCRDTDARAALERFFSQAGLTEDQRARQTFQSRRFDAILRTVGEISARPDWTVLDVGAGTGAVSVALHAKYGGTFRLLDYLEPADRLRAALAEQQIVDIGRCDLSAKDPFASVTGTFDLVLFVEVLEHLLVNPVPLLRRLGALLRPRGHLLVSTPNQARLRNRSALLRARSIREPDAFPDDDTPTFGHVQEYTPGELLSLLRRAGLAPVSLRVVQNLPSMHPTSAQRWGARRLNGALARRWALGDEMIAVARRADQPAEKISKGP